ncbi:TorA maturation chaperone TorD [Humitalea rosea]|uniref:TorA maturation chaperone TorD n=1 Tax=Humitalea rosea TaxID=990373 RepID=A0A2W7K3Q5_9PROT|nr:molecular chaperone TorD family protein [Humitalea rosea]PZW42250.1 TorA maturation chaperone TorD [Humitalea rosea]
MGESAKSNGMAEAGDEGRARLFALLGRLCVAAPDAGLLTALRGLEGDATPIGQAVAALARAAAATDPDRSSREYFDLFIGVGRGEVLPFGSYYITGFLHDRPLADLRADLRRFGLERAVGVAEPEDHLGFLCETYAGLLAGEFPGGALAAERIFARHMAPWVGRCFADIERAEVARFYRAVGALGRTAIEIEQAAAALPA